MIEATSFRVFALLAALSSAAAGADDTKPEVPQATAAAAPDTNDAFHQKGLAIQASLDGIYGKGFWTYLFDDGVLPRPYLVAREFKSNIDLDVLSREYADIFGCLYREFYAEYGERFGLKPITEPVVVLIYAAKDAHKKARETRPELGLPNEEFMGGYYQPGTGILTQWEQDDLWHVVFHEGTHQLIDYATRGARVPQSRQYAWFQEGVADYMGGHKCETTVENGKIVRHFTLGQFIADRFSSVQRGILENKVLPIEQLVDVNFDELHSHQFQQEGDTENQSFTELLYAEGWALVMFLHRNPADKAKFDEYFYAELHGNGGKQKFAEIFLLESKEDWEAFDDEFREWVQVDLRNMRPIKKAH